MATTAIKLTLKGVNRSIHLSPLHLVQWQPEDQGSLITVTTGPSPFRVEESPDEIASRFAAAME